MSHDDTSRPGCYQTNTAGIADRLYWIADQLTRLGGWQTDKVWVGVDIQVTGDDPATWMSRKATIDGLASAFGTTAGHLGSRAYIANVEHGLNIHGTCPPPIEARIAEAEAQLAALRAEAGQVAR